MAVNPLFDLDKNGKISPDEAFLEFMIFSEIFAEDDEDEEEPEA